MNLFRRIAIAYWQRRADRIAYRRAALRGSLDRAVDRLRELRAAEAHRTRDWRADTHHELNTLP